jgi:hypothetical protein
LISDDAGNSEKPVWLSLFLCHNLRDNLLLAKKGQPAQEPWILVVHHVPEVCGLFNTFPGIVFVTHMLSRTSALDPEAPGGFCQYGLHNPGSIIIES